MKMKFASRFAVHPGWRILITDMGLVPSEVLTLAALPADLFSRKDAWITPTEYYQLWQGLELAGGTENIALLLGRAISVEAFDPAIFASLCSRNLNMALERLSEYKRLIGPLVANVTVCSNHTEVVFSCYEYEKPLPRSLGIAEAVFVTQLARIATRHPIKIIYCELVTLPANQGECEEFLGCKIQRGSSNRLHFSVDDSIRPFLTENIAMWDFFEPKLRARLSTLDINATTEDRVRGILLEILPGGLSSIDEVARRLACTPRSLQRRLEKEGVIFRELLGLIRRELACHYLSNSNLSSGEISYLLGFDDSNSFLRAFKTWTGLTPGKFRTVTIQPG
ncbi:AraC family transcriptional regulator [Serratia liquefaciens]|uniref:AraC family transcriptional regulator n=1 Tax=Serratia liquefaciens TaxID=614 RepID=UPI0004AC199C|nr:AraC family transcriptional regulator [Serratia liquefaciens]GAK29500.1 hypothetical protein SLIQ_22710 [Serratia liquefaciens FK01]